MKHSPTPRPWRLKHTLTRWVIEGVAEGEASHRELMAEYDNLDAEANLRWVVQCVNAHDSLVAALEEVAGIPLPGEKGYLRLSGSDAKGAIRIARAALKLARGEP